MPEEATGLAAKEFYALIIAQEGKAQRTLAKFLTLLLNYRHGFTVEPAEDFIQAAGAIRRHGRRIRSVFVIQNNTVSARTTVPALTLGGSIPLFLLLPGREANEQRESVEGTDNVFVCAWEMAFASGEDSLQRILGEALAEVNLEGLLDDDTEGLEQRVKDRLDRLDTLPTLAAVIMHIMRVISDPRATKTRRTADARYGDRAQGHAGGQFPLLHGDLARRPALDAAGGDGRVSASRKSAPSPSRSP